MGAVWGYGSMGAVWGYGCSMGAVWGVSLTLFFVRDLTTCVLPTYCRFQTLLEDQNQGYVDLDRFQEEIYSTLHKSSDEKV